MLKRHQPNLINGDGVLLLDSIVKKIPIDQAICVFHTHVANQMQNNVKIDLLSKIEKIDLEREVIRVYNNIWGKSLLDYCIENH